METPTRLACLGPPRLEVPGGTLHLEECARTEPVEILLRVVAAGPQGLALGSLSTALWPGVAARKVETRFRDCVRCLSMLAGGAPLKLDAEMVAIERRVLEVDSILLEEALAPFLVPFQRNPPAGITAARAALSAALARDPVFLPGFDAPWARAARLRIADKLARAAGQFAGGELETPTLEREAHR